MEIEDKKEEIKKQFFKAIDDCEDMSDLNFLEALITETFYDGFKLKRKNINQQNEKENKEEVEKLG